MEKYIKYSGVLLVLVVVGLLFAYSGSDENVINGIVVPSVPDPVEDAASIGGVDTNGNVVRDSVERMLAEEFGDDPEFYEQAKEYAVAVQVTILDPTPKNIGAYDDLLRCVREDKVFDDLEKVTIATIDTKERSDAYVKAFAGRAVLITDEGC